MWRRKIVLFVFVIMGVLPLSLWGSADFDNNFIVDWRDLAMFADYWLYDYGDNERCASWDLAENGVIDFNDLAVIANQWLADYNFGDFSSFATYWRREVDYRFLDRRFDLAGGGGAGLRTDSGDGVVNFGDFSAFAGEWMTTTNPCDDTNVAGPWEYQNFTGIGGCGSIDCYINGDDYSDYIYDNCWNGLYMVCKPTTEFGGYCAYNYYFNGTRVGLCVYTCGRNYFQVRKNANGRFLQTRHLTRDIPPYDPECSPPNPPCPGCDQGTSGKYDWQVTHYNYVTGVRTVYCRQSYSEPVANNLWEPNQGDYSACELSW